MINSIWKFGFSINKNKGEETTHWQKDLSNFCILHKGFGPLHEIQTRDEKQFCKE